MAQDNVADNFLRSLILFTLVLVYFAPYIVARYNKKRNTVAIFVLNLFLGWTFLGWLLALVWAASKDMTFPQVKPPPVIKPPLHNPSKRELS